jgi:ABC-2 type transport system permease protein
MTIYIYELVQLRGRTAIWSLVLSVLIILMLPVYIDMITGASSEAFDPVQSQDFYEMLGTNFDTIRTPMGVYSFLTTFILFACSINGMSLGISIFLKEYKNKSSEFILTKPYSRTNVYFQKLLAAITSGTIIGIFYTLASIIAMNMSIEKTCSISILVLIGLSTIFIFLFFLVFGFLTGVIAPQIRSAMPISFAATFMAYVFQAFSHKTKVVLAGYLSPYVYFEGAGVINKGGYDLLHLLLFVLISAVILFIAQSIYVNKDVTFVS